jgi:hypothetical protein
MCSLQNCNRNVLLRWINFLCDVPCLTPNPVSLVEKEDDREHERQNDNIKTVEITFIYIFSIFQIRVFDEQHRFLNHDLIFLGARRLCRHGMTVIKIKSILYMPPRIVHNGIPMKPKNHKKSAIPHPFHLIFCNCRRKYYTSKKIVKKKK